jgi:ABC-type bacteriocin/lantibiotic exporter with double-glycine peptidase domain
MGYSGMIQVVGQKTEGDCTIAALATFLGCAYNTVLKTALSVAKNPQQKGMYLTECIRVAKKLGVKLKNCRYSPSKNEGILAVTNHAKGWRCKGKAVEHVVVVWKGWIIDPVGPSIWTKDEYMRCAKAKFGAMLIHE